MDSLYKEYPFGALLIWRTNERLNGDRELGPLTLPDPKESFPIDYVLDGQQRITSVYLTFQTSHPIRETEQWCDVYVDIAVAEDAQESQFVALSEADVIEGRHFPLRSFYDVTKYRALTRNIDEPVAKRLDTIVSRFKEAILPTQVFQTQNNEQVAVIFERINRQGVPLDTMQLLSAWTWNENFHLQEKFAKLKDDLDDYGYDTQDVEGDLLLRCTSAILVDSPLPEKITSISGETIRDRFSEIENGIKGALEFLKTTIGIQRIENLPYPTILIPLSVYFAIPGQRHVATTSEQKTMLVKWFWKSSFSKRYGSRVRRNLEDDIRAIKLLKSGSPTNLGGFQVDVTEEFFRQNTFAMRNVNTKTFILLLAQMAPRDFISGKALDLANKLMEYNKTEFHHLFPKAYFGSWLLLTTRQTAWLILRF